MSTMKDIFHGMGGPTEVGEIRLSSVSEHLLRELISAVKNIQIQIENPAPKIIFDLEPLILAIKGITPNIAINVPRETAPNVEVSAPIVEVAAPHVTNAVPVPEVKIVIPHQRLFAVFLALLLTIDILLRLSQTFR